MYTREEGTLARRRKSLCFFKEKPSMPRGREGGSLIGEKKRSTGRGLWEKANLLNGRKKILLAGPCVKREKDKAIREEMRTTNRVWRLMSLKSSERRKREAVLVKKKDRTDPSGRGIWQSKYRGPSLTLYAGESSQEKKKKEAHPEEGGARTRRGASKTPTQEEGKKNS